MGNWRNSILCYINCINVSLIFFFSVHIIRPEEGIKPNQFYFHPHISQRQKNVSQTGSRRKRVGTVASTLGAPVFTRAMTPQQWGNLIQTKGLWTERKERSKNKKVTKCWLKSFTLPTQDLNSPKYRSTKYIKGVNRPPKFSYFTHIYQKFFLRFIYSFLPEVPSIQRAPHARLREYTIHDFSKKISPHIPWDNILEVSYSEGLCAMLTQKPQIRDFKKLFKR